MAKGHNIHPIIFFIAATLLLSAGSIMTDFPIFIFFVLLSVVAYFLAAPLVNFSFILSSFMYAISSKFHLLDLSGRARFLESMLESLSSFVLVSHRVCTIKTQTFAKYFSCRYLKRPEWMVWNIHTGYLGAAWILLGNFAAYHAFLSENPFQWYCIAILIVIIAGPLIYSFMLNSEPITRKDLMYLYRDKLIVKDVMYLARGEFIVRTSAWISAIILLATLIKSQTLNT